MIEAKVVSTDDKQNAKNKDKTNKRQKKNKNEQYLRIDDLRWYEEKKKKKKKKKKRKIRKKKKKKKKKKWEKKWDYVDEKMNDWDAERKMSDWDANFEMNERFLRRKSIWLMNERRNYLISFDDKELDDKFDHLIDEEQMIWSKSDDYTYWRQ